MLTLISSTLAYIDPGTGSIVIQTLLATVLSLGIYFRRWFGGLYKAVVGMRHSRKARPMSETEERDR